MAYRLIKGDSLITQMWEPHQTSAFLCAIIMKLYMMLTGTTTGIVLFTHFIGLLMRTGVSIYLYKTVKRCISDVPALIAAAMYLLISPKDLLVPEFSNMQLWFGTLTFLTLADYFATRKIWQLLLSAFCLCMGVLSYPSFMIAYFAIFFLLLHDSEYARKDILIYTGMCALIGGAFVGYLLLSVGWDAIITCLPKALAVEPSHTVDASSKLFSYLLNIAQIAGTLLFIGFFGFIIEKAICLYRQKKSGDKSNFSRDRWFLTSWLICMLFLFLHILSVENTGATAYPLLLITGLGFYKRNLLSEMQKRIYYSGLWIGLMNLIATMLLSDHGILQAVGYMHTAICISVIPLYCWFQECTPKNTIRRLYVIGIHTFLLLTVFRCIYIHVPISGRGQICSLASDLALIRSGPAIGIITDEKGAAMQRDSMEEWKEYINPGDTIWLLGEPVDTLGYLYEDVEVGAPTVMSTPTYNSELLYYWEINPEKYPDVVILASGYGELTLELLYNEWLMQWLNEEYQAATIIDGNYWRYYFKEQK